MTASVYIDGRSAAVGCKWVDAFIPVVFDGVEAGDTLRPFRFAPLRPGREEEDDEGSPAMTTAYDITAVSTIRVDVWRVKITGTYQIRTNVVGDSTGPGDLSVREQQVKKGGVMRDTLTRYVFGESA